MLLVRHRPVTPVLQLNRTSALESRLSSPHTSPLLPVQSLIRRPAFPPDLSPQPAPGPGSGHCPWPRTPGQDRAGLPSSARGQQCVPQLLRCCPGRWALGAGRCGWVGQGKAARTGFRCVLSCLGLGPH